MPKKKKNRPTLRFPEFSGEWEEKKLGELLTFKNGLNASKEQYGSGVKFINVLDIINNHFITHEKIIGSVNVSEKEIEKNTVQYGDILFQRSSETRDEVGQANIYLDKEYNAVFGGFVIRGQGIVEYEPMFMNYLLKTQFARKEITTKSGGSTRFNVGQETLKEVNIFTTFLKEQKKIAQFLTAIDKKIQQLQEKKTLLAQYKKGLMQQLFSQKIRFKDETGKAFPKWEEKVFNEVAERVKRKNKENNRTILTISAQDGLVDQENYFNKRIASRDVTGYYLLHKDDFAYNKSYSAGYPMGAFKRLKNYEKGVLSTLYICFKIIDDNINEYFEHFFESGSLNKQISQIAQEGARNHGLLNISVIDFFNTIKVSVPCIEEQKKIANLLTAIDEKIETVNQQLEQAKAYKKGLLQQLFV